MVVRISFLFAITDIVMREVQASLGASCYGIFFIGNSHISFFLGLWINAALSKKNMIDDLLNACSFSEKQMGRH